MFTRYNGIDVPKNYSGNRFKHNMETEMKTHKAEQPMLITPPIKKSVSPQSFQSEIDKVAEESTQINELDQRELTEISEVPPALAPIDKDENNLHPCDTTSASDTGIGAFIESLRDDDILLIALILLLAESEGHDNKELIVTLALLLLYR